jgi:hypothetical protein
VPVAVGRRDVEQHEVGRARLHLLEQRAPAGRAGHVVAVLLQHPRDGLQDRGVVVHDQDARAAHGGLPASRPRRARAPRR